MDALRFNKIAAAVLCAGLLIMGFSKVGSFLVNPKDLRKMPTQLKLLMWMLRILK